MGKGGRGRRRHRRDGRREGWREEERMEGGRGEEGGRGDGDGEQTDAAQTPEGLRSHIFLASSLRGTEICESTRVHVH